MQSFLCGALQNTIDLHYLEHNYQKIRDTKRLPTILPTIFLIFLMIRRGKAKKQKNLEVFSPSSKRLFEQRTTKKSGQIAHFFCHPILTLIPL
jgi:hypothetical protein